MRENRGITLIALVVSIIVLIILAGISITAILGENGILVKAKYAKEQTEIANYMEKIALIKAEIRLQKVEEEIQNQEIKAALDREEQKDWVKETMYITDQGIEKIKLETKEGYQFYITGDTTEYKGKGTIAEEIAVLEVKPKNVDTSHYTRKTERTVDSLFDIRWGKDGKGTVEYQIVGTLDFNQTNYTSNTIHNLAELEIGEYLLTCKVTSPTNQIVTAQKEIHVTNLASTKVVDENNGNQEQDASAIYSAYDLAYFRDLVNEKGETNRNAKLMEDINLEFVCGESIGSWIPIGKTIGDFESYVAYEGILDGDNKNISNLYIHAENSGLGLLGSVNEGTIKNMTVSGKITNLANNLGNIGGIVGCYWREDKKEGQTNLKNLHNKVEIEATHAVRVAGVVGGCDHTSIEDCSNEANIIGNNCVGGIVGYVSNAGISSRIEKCYNIGQIEAGEGLYDEGHKAYTNLIGGIVGYLEDAKGIISQCYNHAKGEGIKGKKLFCGGIVGACAGSIEHCYNLSNVTGGEFVGGICGTQWNSNTFIRNVYNNGVITGSKNVGGIIGEMREVNCNNFINIKEVSSISTENKINEICGDWGVNNTWEEGTWIESTQTSEQEMKEHSDETIKSYLGSYFKKDSNGGLPVLIWQ